MSIPETQQGIIAKPPKCANRSSRPAVNWSRPLAPLLTCSQNGPRFAGNGACSIPGKEHNYNLEEAPRRASERGGPEPVALPQDTLAAVAIAMRFATEQKTSLARFSGPKSLSIAIGLESRVLWRRHAPFRRCSRPRWPAADWAICRRPTRSTRRSSRTVTGGQYTGFPTR
jgi:hypothetical protein